MHFLTEKKVKFSDTIPILITTQNLNFNKLSEEVFDSLGFTPFAKAPAVMHFNWNSLRDTNFHYDALSEMPLHFEVSALNPPLQIKAQPNLRSTVNNPVYEFGEPLKGNIISCVFKDKEGFFWIASQQGLYRYDGETLLLFTTAVANTPVGCMIEDSEGKIWISTTSNNSGVPGKGIFVIDIKHSIIKHLSTAQGLSNNIVVKLFLDNKNRIWATTSGIDIIDEHTNTLKHFNSKQGLSNNVTIDILEDNQNRIWIPTLFGGLNIIDFKNQKIKYMHKTTGLVSDSLTIVQKDDQNRIWIGALRGELTCVDAQKTTITTYNSEQGLNKNLILNFLIDHKGNIWLETNESNGIKGGELEIINPTKKLIKNYTIADGLSDQNVNSIVQDKNGLIWVATNSGLNIINNRIKHSGNNEITALTTDNNKNIWIATVNKGVEILNPFTGTYKSLNHTNGLSNEALQDIRAINGEIFIASESGLDVVDSACKRIQHISNNVQLNNKELSTILKDAQKKLWISGLFKGIEVVDSSRQKSYNINPSLNISDSFIYEIKQDKKDKVWFTTREGVIGIINTNGVVRYLDTNLIKKHENGSQLHYDTQLCFDEEQNVWVSESNIVYKINRNQDSITVFNNQTGLFNAEVLSIKQYGKRILVSTNQGINVINPPSLANHNWLIQSYGKNYGINKEVNSQRSDAITADGIFLWGDKGITYLNSTSFNSTPQTHVTGIDIFNQSQYFVGQSGNQIVQEDTLWSADKTKMYLKGQTINTSFNGSQSKMKWDSTTGLYNLPVNLILPYDENNIQFHFVQADLKMQDTIWYRYVLQGKDKQWSEKTSNTFSNSYFNLTDGKYIFKVSSLYNNVWSKPVEFSFTIATPWWKTWWAYLLYVFIIGMIYTTLRSLNLNRQNKLLEVKVKQRTEQLNQSLQELKSTQAQLIQSEKMASLGELTAGIAHEIQNPLNFVNNFSEVNKEMLEELKAERLKPNADKALEDDLINDLFDNSEKINHHGKRADAIVKGMLQHSKQTSGKKEPTDINSLCDEYLRLAYHGLRAKDKSFNADFKTDLDETIGKINMVPQDIGRVLLNLFNNAFYAVKPPNPLKGELWQPLVSVKTRKIKLSNNNAAKNSPSGDGGIEIIVSDNGNGIPQNIIDKIFQPFFTTKPTGQGTGLGLSLAYDIITKEHSGTIKVESKEGEGSMFIIHLSYE